MAFENFGGISFCSFNAEACVCVVLSVGVVSRSLYVVAYLCGHRPGECPVGLNQDFAPVPIEGFTCPLFRELAGFDSRFGARKLRTR